jgi:glycosyltransferase involved in cell wall biosynthesis
MKLADRVITSGEFIRDTLIKENNMIEGHIVSIPAGADEKKYSASLNLEDIRPRFNLKKQDFVIGMVSVLRSWKGHNYVIEAMILLVKKVPNIHLLIVGDGPKKDEILKLIDKHSLSKYITLAGHQNDPAPFYKSMDLIILPSYAGEATSQTLPQAMLMGKPVISTNIGGLPEVVINNDTGLVVPPKDSQAIAFAISTMYLNSDFRNKMAKQGRDHALKRFTFRKMVDSTYNVYIDLLKKK